MCRALPVLAFLVLTSCADGAERIIRTAAELKDFKFSNPTNRCLYDLTGIITDTSPIPHFTQFRRVVVLDESGACCVRCPTDRCPPIGVTARLRGRIYPQPSEWTSTVTRSADVLGPAQVPPPVDATVDQLFDEALNYRLVRVSGTVVEILPDEIDPRDYYLVLKSGDRFLRISVNNSQIPVEDAEQFIDAEIRVTGIFRTDGYGFKLTSRSELHVSNPADIAILRPPPDDPFDLPPLENMRYYSPERIATIGKRAIAGRVLAVWLPDRFLLRTDDARNIGVRLLKPDVLPCPGDAVRAVGFPQTDLFNINLSRGRYRLESATGSWTNEAPQNVTAGQLLVDENGRLRINTPFHGRIIRLRGIARGLPTDNGRFNLECGKHLIRIDASARPELADALVAGCVLEATGVCIVEADTWQSTTLFPQARGFFLVPRSPDDLHIISRPPWWTIERLLIVIGALVAALAGIVFWNRILNRIVNRRSRELLKEQIAHASSVLRVDERTRLAVELHDSLSQNLAAVSMQLSSARSAKAAERPVAEERHLVTAEKMLDSCRTELRLCLWDLRSDTMEEADFSEAIRKTLKAIAHGSNVTVDFRAARSHVSDTTAHAILMIVRELVSNAIRHGHAKNIDIAGDRRGSELAFSVRDDGCGFDVATRPGQSEGHFGLEGIEHRVRNLNGTFSLTSTPGHGTTATVTLNLDK